jgi:3-oxoadipate enol-lactonase
MRAVCHTDILDALGLDHAHFVGNSWGGMVGATFGANYPDRIGRAVLINCTASAARRRQKLQYAVLTGLTRVLGGIGGPLTRSVIRSFVGMTTLHDRPDVVVRVRASVQQVDVASGIWAVRSVVPAWPDQRALMGSVRSPVLIAGGAEDATFPPADASRKLDAAAGTLAKP